MILDDVNNIKSKWKVAIYQKNHERTYGYKLDFSETLGFPLSVMPFFVSSRSLSRTRRILEEDE